MLDVLVHLVPVEALIAAGTQVLLPIPQVTVPLYTWTVCTQVVLEFGGIGEDGGAGEAKGGGGQREASCGHHLVQVGPVHPHKALENGGDMNRVNVLHGFV